MKSTTKIAVRTAQRAGRNVYNVSIHPGWWIMGSTVLLGQLFFSKPVYCVAWTLLCSVVALYWIHPTQAWTLTQRLYHVLCDTPIRRAYTMIGVLLLVVGTTVVMPLTTGSTIASPVAVSIASAAGQTRTIVRTKIVLVLSRAVAARQRAQDAVPRPAVTSNLSAYILHSPSISSGTIQRALEAMGSPMAGATATDSHGVTKNLAQYLYDAGRVTGVDPAVMLAVCAHESSCGKYGVARCSKSLSNQRPTTENTPICPGADGYYQAFSDWTQGVDGMYQLLWKYGHGFGGFTAMHTWAQAVNTWAPAADHNDPAGYSADVYSKIASWEGR